MARAAEAVGWSTERPDFSDIDAGGNIGDIALRLQRLVERCQSAPRPLVLAGSSMGAFISGLASLQIRCAGLFLLAPPVVLDGFSRRLSAAVQPTVVVHGWHDELIPAGDVVRWAQRRHDRLILLDDNHRLEAHVDYIADEFARFLQSLA